MAAPWLRLHWLREPVLRSRSWFCIGMDILVQVRIFNGVIYQITLNHLIFQVHHCDPESTNRWRSCDKLLG
jgi:hypothetical protein